VGWGRVFWFCVVFGPPKLDDVWSDIWDFVVMEIDELRSIIPPE
jgi:hypothetical protein